MGPSPVDKELPWDVVTKTVAQAVIEHMPDVTATEAYYCLVMQHIARVLWGLGAGDRAVKALGAVLRATVPEVREAIADASAATRRKR